MSEEDDRVGRVAFAVTAVVVVLLLIGGVGLVVLRSGDTTASGDAATIGSTAPPPTIAQIEMSPTVAAPTIAPAPAPAPETVSSTPTSVPSLASTLGPAAAMAAFSGYVDAAMARRFEDAYRVLLPRGDGERVISFEEFVEFWSGLSSLTVIGCESIVDTAQIQTVECVYDFTRTGENAVLRERVQADWVVGPDQFLQLANQRSLGLE